jgi:DNA helicase-2/ATP-dependent DNA helicase PcrA
LEFPVVFLVGMEEGLFPSLRAWEEPDPMEIEEERRLCYVGMTRARQKLYLTHVVVRRLWGNVTYQEPARFFQELPSSKVEFRDFTRTRVVAQPQLRAIPGGRALGGSSFGTSSSSPADDFSDSPGLIGRKIRHPDYGLGTVIGVDGSGSACKVQVEFAGRDRRKFLWKFLESLLQDQSF